MSPADARSLVAAGLEAGARVVSVGLGDPGAVSDLARKQNLYMRDAAYYISVNRVAKACRDRGWV